MADEDWDILDRKEFGNIFLCLAQMVAFNITKAKMTEELIGTLVNLYKMSSTSNKVFLMKHLCNMKMVKGGYFVDYLNDYNMITR